MKKFWGYILIVFAIIFAIFIFLKSNVDLNYFGGIRNNIIVNKTSNAVEIFNGHKFYGLANYKSDSINVYNVIGTNFRGYFTSVIIFILSLFMLPKLYVISYILFFAGLFLINPQKINKKLTLGLVLILAFLIRLSGLGEYPMWIDEVFTVLFVKSKWINVFKDYCNPPVFYIVSKLWLMIIPYSEAFARFFSVLAGVGGVFSIYFLLKQKFDERTGIVGAILMCFSFWGIYYSQELRCYSLIMFLAPLCTLALFNMIEKGRNKDFILFTLLSAIIVNTHLYGILYTVANFIYYIFKNYKDKRIYFSGLFIILSFMPYFFITFLEHSVLGNNGISENMFLESIKIVVFFTTFLLFIGFVVLIAKILKKKIESNNIQKAFLKYCFYIIVSVILFTIVISIFRPIIYYRYYSIIYPFVLSIIAIIISRDYKTKYNGILLTALVLVNIIIQLNVKFPPSLRYGNFYDVIIFEKENGLTNKNVVVVIDYLTYYSKYYKLKGVTTMLYKIFDIDKIEKDTTVYLLSFNGDKRDIKGKRILLPDNMELIRIDK